MLPSQSVSDSAPSGTVKVGREKAAGMLGGSHWKSWGWVILEALAGRLAGWLGGVAGASELGQLSCSWVAQTQSPALGPRNLLKPGNKAAASAWAEDTSPVGTWADAPLLVPTSHAGFFSGLVSPWPQPSALPVLRQRYGQWEKGDLLLWPLRPSPLQA